MPASSTATEMTLRRRLSLPTWKTNASGSWLPSNDPCERRQRDRDGAQPEAHSLARRSSNTL
eukprot:8572000-Lingulodinium_polyedra.AAC.1